MAMLKWPASKLALPTPLCFGNGADDPNSEVSKALKSERTYYVLEELGTPSQVLVTRLRLEI